MDKRMNDDELFVTVGNAPGVVPQLRVANLDSTEVVRRIYRVFANDPRVREIPHGVVLVSDSYTVNEQGYHSFQLNVGLPDKVFKCPVCPFPHPRSRITLSFHLNRPAILMRCSSDTRVDQYTRPIECDPSLDLNHPLVPVALFPILAKMQTTIPTMRHPWLQRANPMWLTSLLVDADNIDEQTAWNVPR